VRVIDALGREVAIAAPPRRVVSLVPSETETVAVLAGVERLVGRTDFCEEPRGAIETVASVGGTKKFDPARVIALAPDLVLANQEENGRADVEALIAHGLPVHVSFPCTLESAIAHVHTTARLLHLDPRAHAAVRALDRASSEIADRARSRDPLPVLVPIWRDPWMTFDARTYASDLLAHCGARNVFADRPRRYPLAADLGTAAPKATDKDTRYPRFSLEEARARAPALILLPDEPYRFEERDARELADAIPAASIRFVSGKDLFWYGLRVATAVTCISAAIAAR
jgi:ABC-type Fe3+-hydroxamate transport system substrate-binding protein